MKFQGHPFPAHTVPLILAVLLCLSLTFAPAAQAQRLPDTVVPAHYQLTLAPDIQAATYTGGEKIDVNVKQATKSITLNAIEITFDSVTITAAGKEQTAVVTLDPGKEQATFTVPNEIPAGSATITIHFSGILNNELRGFYLSKTPKRNYAVSQFEPTDARRAFPSFDEPGFKATFDIALIVDADDTAISNGVIVSDHPGPGVDKHTLVFSTTPKMSTYLVAFLVGDFECSTGQSDGVLIRACATPDKVGLTTFALHTAESVLHYYNDYFGIPYPLKKLDLIGIPDFEAGAMENFGAITYRESDMLLDPITATIGARENVAVVVAHEMAHQWFGDLVTMEWWNNIWLNEGFATWMENKPVESLYPEWHLDQGVSGEEQATLNYDAQPTTRSIRAPEAVTPDQINQLFDGISYGKAGAVLSMVENYLGEEAFRKGVHAYLAAHEYGNATAEDFWKTMAATSGKPVDQIMESLVVQPGVPVISFGEPKHGEVSVAQKRFFLSPTARALTTQKWTLPICFRQPKGKQDCQLLMPDTTSLKVPSGNLFFANAAGKGYYRTVYSPAQYNALVASVETALTPAERISLAGDEWAQVRSDHATVGDYLNLLASIKGDPNADVLATALSPLSTIYNNVASSQEQREALADWVRHNFSPEYAKLGPASDSDSADKRKLRAQLFQTLGYQGKDPAVLQQARQIASQFLDNQNSVDPTLGQTALAVAAQNGDSELFDKLENVYETSPNPEFKDTALRLLAEFNNPALEQRALEYAISGKVRNQDAAIQFAIALGVPETREAAWAFIKSHWDQVHALLTPEMGQILVDSTGAFCSANARDDVSTFFAAHKVEAADVSVKHAVEHINGCMELRSQQEANLKQWINTQQTSKGD
jgi:aminopeptidase N/puromycin-sensitive aminopeptidase